MRSEWPQTPSQTVGPFFGYALPFAGGPQLVAASEAGRIVLHGSVLDGGGAPVPDALLELWQLGADGEVVRRSGSRARELGRFTGFGRAPVDAGGHYEFATVRPGLVGPGTARWVLLTVFARGLSHHLSTRAYLVDADEPVPTDPLLERIDPARRETLLARADGPGSYRFDLHLQGDQETVFLQYAEPR